MYFLYDVRWEPVLYTTYLIILITVPFVFWDCRKYYVKNQCLKEALKMDFPIVPELPKADSLLEQNYQYLLRKILEAWKDERVEQKRVDAERDD